MRNILLLIVIAAIGFMVACDDHDTLPPYTVSTIFNVTKMTHRKDTINSKGDTIWLTAIGGINDTIKPYSISATVKSTDTTSLENLIAGNYFKTVKVKYDTVNKSKTGLFRWIANDTTFYVVIPAVPANTKIKTTALFTYSLNVSSQIGNQTGTDSKFTYAK